MSAGNGRMRRFCRADLEQWLREQGHVRRRRTSYAAAFFDPEPERSSRTAGHLARRW
jgi:hypothetical protein